MRTRQLSKIKIKFKVSSEAWNARQGRITQIDHWTSSVGNSPKFFSIEEQCGSLSKN